MISLDLKLGISLTISGVIFFHFQTYYLQSREEPYFNCLFGLAYLSVVLICCPNFVYCHRN